MNENKSNIHNNAELTLSQKLKATIVFGLCCLVLGAICGAILWLVLKIINVLTTLIWDMLPEALGLNMESMFGLGFNIIMCFIGAILIALIISRLGFLPHTMEEALEIFKRDGGYPYNNLPTLAIVAAVPLVFGATLGPEAGLTGLIIGLCCWVGDSLKTRGAKLLNTLHIKASDENVNDFRDVMVRTGAATVLTVVFATPLAGLVDNLETEYLEKDKAREGRILPKWSRVTIYIFGIVGGIIAFKLLNEGFFLLCQIDALNWMWEEGGLPRFPQFRDYQLDQLIWFIPLVVAGILLGLFYKGVNFVTVKASDAIKKKFALGTDDKANTPAKMTFCGALLLTTIAAVFLAVVGHFFPMTMFSGEHQLGPLMENFSTYAWWMLIVIALLKLVLSCVCFNFGWKGGLIFPILFSGATLGLGLSLLIGIDGFAAAAITCSAMYAIYSKKPALTVALMLLIFPITYLPYTLVSAFAACLVAKLASKQR